MSAALASSRKNATTAQPTIAEQQRAEHSVGEYLKAQADRFGIMLISALSKMSEDPWHDYTGVFLVFNNGQKATYVFDTNGLSPEADKAPFFTAITQALRDKFSVGLKSANLCSPNRESINSSASLERFDGFYSAK